MKIKEVIGIDVSKLTLDLCIHTRGAQGVFENNPEGIQKMAAWSLRESGMTKESLLFVFEHTGIYSHLLIRYLGDNGYLFYVVPGLEVKRSFGITRGKDDRADAKRIALYGYRIRHEALPTTAVPKVLEQIKRVMSMRRKLVGQRAGHLATLGEQKRVLDHQENIAIFRAQEEILNVLNVQIALLESEMDKLIKQDAELCELYGLLKSVKGIGDVTARFLIVHTVGFTVFANWRKFASYCGIAPFPNQSGTSVRGRTKVSHLANKEGKTLLNLCAASAIQSNPEMRLYYQRRVEEGKNKMSTLNIIRNKLLSRAFAVAKRRTPYVDMMKFAS